MSAEDRAAVRHVGAEDARRSRVRQGLPERIEDPAAVAVLAAILRDTSASPPPPCRTRAFSKEFQSVRLRVSRSMSVGGSDGAAWLEGDAARAFACDASIIPVVLGDVNYAVLDDLVWLCAELARLNHAEATDSEEEHQSPTLRVREALELQIIGKAVDLLSGPGGLASFLLRSQLGARLGGPSLPLVSDTARPSRPRSATPSSCATSTASTASGPAAATGPLRRVKYTMSSTSQRAVRPA
jgi:hypothetical protein